MNEHEWWASAPAWAKWHTWDCAGKVWWEKRPKFDEATQTWQHNDFDDGDTLPEWWFYWGMSLPVEIDPAKTLRKRPKQVNRE